MTVLIHPCLHDVMRHSTTVKNDISLLICIYVSRYVKLISYNLSLHLFFLLLTLYSLLSTLYSLLSTLYSLPSTLYPLLLTPNPSTCEPWYKYRRHGEEEQGIRIIQIRYYLHRTDTCQCRTHQQLGAVRYDTLHYTRECIKDTCHTSWVQPVLA